MTYTELDVLTKQSRPISAIYAALYDHIFKARSDLSSRKNNHNTSNAASIVMMSVPAYQQEASRWHRWLTRQNFSGRVGIVDELLRLSFDGFCISGRSELRDSRASKIRDPRPEN